MADRTRAAGSRNGRVAHPADGTSGYFAISSAGSDLGNDTIALQHRGALIFGWRANVTKALFARGPEERLQQPFRWGKALILN